MRKKYYFIFVSIFFLCANANGQTVEPVLPSSGLPGCGYVEDPAIRQYTQELISKMYADKIDGKSNLKALAVYKVPVVVHVIEPSTGTSLISDAQIASFISNLNSAYRGTGYYSGSPDIEIEFELAKWDPNCQPTTGITHYDASGNAQYISKGVFNTGVSWATVQSWRTWNKRNYMNIWIVNKMDNGAAGVGGPSEGLINLASAITGSHDYVTPHEVGHFLGVAHPFPQYVDTCGCGDGDGLNDTPKLMSYGIDSPCTHESACSVAAQNAPNPCENNAPFGDIQLNIMNYVGWSCDQKFTNDQKNLMRAMLTTYHATLLTSPVLGPTAPVASASLSGAAEFCTSGSDFPTISAVCICSSVSQITRNGAVITDYELLAKPLLSPGQSVTWNFGLTCSNGQTATKSVKYYRPGVTNINTTCNDANTYSVSFDNPLNSTITASAGTLSGNSVINIPNADDLTLTVTDANLCGEQVLFERPCCAQNLMTSSQCHPTADNGLDYYFGLTNFSFGDINKTSSGSANDGANYIDRACDEFTNVYADGSYPITVTAYFTNPHYVKVYIDYNNDGIFTSPDELVLSGPTPGGSINSISGLITIPATAVKNTRLRVRALADWVSSSDACTINGASGYGSGQIEDYSVSILNALPVNLISFDGKAEKEGVNLKWSTASETKNKGFEIHRSLDAVHFENKGFVDGNETTSSRSDYQYADRDVNPESTYYYRLKQLDQDGSFEMSRTISVKGWSESLTPYVFPNPAIAGQFTLSMPDLESYSIAVYSIDGLKQPLNLLNTGRPGETLISGQEKLPAGLYLLKLNSKIGSIEKVIKVIVP